MSAAIRAASMPFHTSETSIAPGLWPMLRRSFYFLMRIRIGVLPAVL